MIQWLSWDTEFFGFQTGKENIADLEKLGLEEAKALANGYRLVYLFCPLDPQGDLEVPTHISAFAQRLGAKAVDTKVVFGGIPAEPEPGITFFDGVEEWQPDMGKGKLYDLAFQSGEYSRYKTDHRFPKGTFEKMYRIWVDNSLNGEFAQKVFVIRIEKEMAGFATLNFNTPFAGTIGLIAVDPAFRGQKIGSRLMAAAMEHTRRAGYPNFRVATQLENQSACDFYKKLGLKIVEAVKVYHWWL